MQKSTCFAVLVSLDDILVCHFPFVSLAMFCQQLHMCLYLVVVCSSIFGGSLSTPFLVYFRCVHLSLLSSIVGTVVPVMNGHPRDQAKVSVHCRWPLVTGTDGQAGDAKYNTPWNTT